MFHGVAHQIHQALEFQFSSDIVPVPAHCVPADVRELSDFFTAFAFG
jgi:hypothetical protein